MKEGRGMSGYLLWIESTGSIGNAARHKGQVDPRPLADPHSRCLPSRTLGYTHRSVTPQHRVCIVNIYEQK